MTSGDDLSLAAAIVALRAKRHWSQAKLAAEVGTTERNVKRWEQGQVPGKKFRPPLIELGINGGFFKTRVTRAQFERRLRAAEREIQALRQLLPSDEPGRGR